MEIRKFEFNFYGENTYVIWDASSSEAAIVDPGMINPDEEKALVDFISANALSPKFVLLTHVHLDHTFGVNFIRKLYGIDVFSTKADYPFALAMPEQGKQFHMPFALEPVEIDRFVADGSTLRLGNEEIKVLATPGHTPGGVCYYVPASGFILTGDTLFRESVGRTDFPGGNHSTLIRSIQQKLTILPPETVVYPGHGPATTIAHELDSNPFI